ncbi:MAG: SPOR domain-containing protein [Candidatus Omnitrophota bacterium]
MLDSFLNLKPWVRTLLIIVGILVLIIIFNNVQSPDISLVEDTGLNQMDDEKQVVEPIEDLSVSLLEKAKPDQIPVEQKMAIEAKRIPLEKTSLKEFYSVQVASFRNSQKANELAQQLKKDGLNAEAVIENTKENGTWHRVFVGQFIDKTQAMALQSKLKSKFSDCFVKLRK